MTSFLLKRMGWMVLTLWAVFTVSFGLMKIVPGGPFSAERKLPAEIERNQRQRYNLNDHWTVQYRKQLIPMVNVPPDFGYSYKKQDYKVNEIIAEGFPVSASLGIFALVFALTLGLTAGIISAQFRHSWLDLTFMTMATIGIAIPNFVLASLAIILFVFIIQIFPAAGWGTLQQIMLPALCLGAPFAAYIARLTRTGMLEVLGQDYIRTAYAKGLSSRRVVLRHALKGAVLPVVSYLGPAVAGILTGSLVLEQIFFLPGMGTHFVQAALLSDYTVAMGMVLVYTFLLYVMNTMVDISYAVIDPRVKIDE